MIYRLCLFPTLLVTCIVCFAVPSAKAQKLGERAGGYFVSCEQKDQRKNVYDLHACIPFDREKERKDQIGDVDQAIGEGSEDYIRRAIASSKIIFSGSVLRVKTNVDCTQFEWFVVAQAKESSSVLIYNPTDIGTEYCDFAQPGHPSTNEPVKNWVYLPLPIHVMWAEVTGYRIIRGDTWHKAPSPLPTESSQTIPNCNFQVPDLRPCDRFAWPQRLFYRTGPLYNRLTQPGTGQGAISFTPVIGSGTQSFSYDAQVNVTSRFGHGWIGTPFIFEKSGAQNANLDSLVLALSYEIHPESGGNIVPYRGKQGVRVSLFAVRDAEFQVRSGFELAPTTPHDLNSVQSELLKMPIVLPIYKQPSALTFYPLFGLEQVHHVSTHIAGETADQKREVTGGDASLRWPWLFAQNLLGDKPVTIDFSYRYRWLSNAEPTTNYQAAAPNTHPTEFLSAESHSYVRATYSEPVSSFLTFKVTVQHGSLPPDFRSLGYTLQLGLSFSDPGSFEH